MKRPTGVAVAAVLTYSGAVILALASCGFFLVGVLVATGDEGGQPVSVAIAGMALSGGLSLLILAVLAAWLAMNTGEWRDWARSASAAAFVARAGQSWRGVSLAARHSWFAEFLSSQKDRRLEHHP